MILDVDVIEPVIVHDCVNDHVNDRERGRWLQGLALEVRIDFVGDRGARAEQEAE